MAMGSRSWLGARASSLRCRRPAPLARLCYRSSARSVPSALLCSFAPPWRPCAPPGLLRRRGAVALPAPWGSLHCCEALFSYPCIGVVPAPIALWRNSCALWPAMLFPPAAGCPCRAPAGAPSPAPGGPLLCRSPFGRHIGCSLRSRFLSAGAVFRGQGVRGFPLGAVARGLPPCPPARVPATCTQFLSRAGRGDPYRRARGSRPCAPRGGRARRPPAPPAAPTRGAVFFIVFCFLRFCKFGALSALHRIKKHKYS